MRLKMYREKKTSRCWQEVSNHVMRKLKQEAAPLTGAARHLAELEEAASEVVL